MLYFLPTPIGNLEDITHRSLDILNRCDIVICEDTRVSKSLISLLNLKFNLQISPKSFFSLHSHNENEFFDKFDKTQFNEQICVYMSDAGMPCISDPGVSLVKFAWDNGINYEVLPGANAAILAAAASGIIKKEFSFLGFLPNTGKDRLLEIENLMKNPYPCVIYESPKRILNLIENLAKFDENRQIFAIKEATKKFETKFKGKICEVLKDLKIANLNGEWCVVVDKSPFCSSEKITTKDIMDLNLPPKQKAKLLSKITGEEPKKIYANLIK